MTILIQPAVDALLVAYKPIEFKVLVDISVDDCPQMFCDVYINNIYYKSISRTYPLTMVAAVSKTFQFDVQDIAQEYLTKMIANPGGVGAVEHPGGSLKLKCRFRNTTINVDGFQVSTFTAPIQATNESAAVAGTGDLSNEFYVINATIQNNEHQVLTYHLNGYKQGTWSSDIYPLTHRPASCKIKLEQSDYFPVLHTSALGIICYILNYKPIGGVYTIINSCSTPPVINIEWSWNKITNAFVDLTSKLNGTFSYINWGDGTINSSLTHTYTVAGTYDVYVYNSNVTNFLFSTDNVEDLDIITLIFYSPYTVQRLEIDKNNIGSMILTNLINLTTFKGSANGFSGFGTIPANVTDFVAQGNSLNVATVNQILIDLDSNGLFNGICDIHGQTPPAVPTGAGATAKANLISKGWTVSTD